MNLKTVKERMRISPLSDRAILELHELMKNYTDEETSMSGDCHYKWVLAVKHIHRKYGVYNARE